VGIAIDRHADGALPVAADGRLIDGDQIIAVAAVDRHRRGELHRGAVVITVMTNLGFRLGMAEHGIEVIEVPVGDRHVLQALARSGASLGGEQSGHVIFADRATTGDGLLTAVQLLDILARTGQPLAELADAAMTRLPQVLRNVRVQGDATAAAASVSTLASGVEEGLGDHGRVLIRPSGTEPLVRVMVEAPTAAEAEQAADRLATAVSELS
jgi:phosphoglucosamine mutase